MSWAALLGLAAACYSLKALGPVVLGERPVPARVSASLALLAVPLLSALIVVQGFSTGQAIVLDARAAGVAAAAVALALRAPFLVVIVVASAAAALVRLV